jgi:hypothetical protein
MTRHESGFNPDAAAGTTSASGLGQFVDDTTAAYGINTNTQRFDAADGSDAMVRHYLENKRLATNHGSDLPGFLRPFGSSNNGSG